ncbi:MAG: sulfate permease [Burkholderiales bacterium]|nr:sulfate permease [Burkholderiales bacterium]
MSRRSTAPTQIERFVPFVWWIRRYTREDLEADVTAGIVTAILLVPQGMAFAILAGLPAQIGLYASILPPIIYALLGTSRTLAVGPVSVAAIMVGYALQGLPEGVDPLQATLTLALLAGTVLLLMGFAGMGLMANFLSHPVLTGFIHAAVVLIILNQLPNLIGISAPTLWNLSSVLDSITQGLSATHGITLLIGVASIALLLFADGLVVKLFIRLGLSQHRAMLISRTAPLMVVILATAAVTTGNLDFVATVGKIPEGIPMPRLELPETVLAIQLLPAAILIGLVGYVESVSVAITLANRRRQQIDTNQELFALGAANLAGGMAGGMPVAGGFSRTMVNFVAGARTQLAAIITAALVAAVALFFTPLLEHLPKASLAAIIIVAVLKLIDPAAIFKICRYDRIDGTVLAITALGVFIDIEAGLAVGIALSLISFVLRAARPHVAIMGRIPGSEHFRNVNRHNVETWPQLLFLRVDENLTFANAALLESLVNHKLATMSDIHHVILVLSRVNAIDSTALEVLERLSESGRDGGVTIHLSDVSGPVMDRLERSQLISLIAPGQVFLSAHEAAEALAK